jgi:putative ABC transport system ATP-binding protein
MVTHDPAAASHTDRVVFLADGKVVDEMRDPSPEKILERMKRLDSHHATATAASSATSATHAQAGS